MKVSVIIPAYNEEKYLGKALASLKKQTVKPDEIIVIDNNSQDKTAEIAKSFGAIVITEKNQGITPARNKGFDSAKYEIIARCDADCIVPSNWIEKIIQNFETQEIDALSGPVIYYDSVMKLAAEAPSIAYFKTLSLFSKGNNYLVGMNMILTKEIWNKVKNETSLDDTKVHEDVDLSLNLIKIGAKIGFDKTLIVKASSRRMMKKPDSFFLEYPLRMIKTFFFNRSQ